MIEKFSYIDRETARALLERVKYMAPSHRGIDRRAYLFEEYAVLSTSRLKLRNVIVRDDDLAHLDDIMEKLMALRRGGVNVVPILGYCYDPASADGEGFLIMERAKGAELYDDAVICRYEAWALKDGAAYLESEADPAAYILSRTREVAAIPQEHFDKFIADVLAILKNDILIDFQGKSNFFYDEKEGFGFIDLDSHTDDHYGLTEEVVPAEAWAAVGGFVPCHFGAGTAAFAPLALDPNAIQSIGGQGLERLAADNLRIYEKCISAMRANGIPEDILQNALRRIKVFGQ